MQEESSSHLRVCFQSIRFGMLEHWSSVASAVQNISGAFWEVESGPTEQVHKRHQAYNFVRNTLFLTGQTLSN